MSTPRSKYSKKQTQKKEIRDGAINSNDDRTEENGAEHSGIVKLYMYPINYSKKTNVISHTVGQMVGRFDRWTRRTNSNQKVILHG